MGSAAGTAKEHQPPTQDEMDGYFAVKKAYEALSPEQQQQEGELVALADIYRKLSTCDASRRCENGVTESEEVARLLAMSEDQRVELGKAVLEAALHNENGLRAAMATGDDYGKSFSGTKFDTQVENEYASLVRGDQPVDVQQNVIPILRLVKCNNEEELAQLRSAGKWLRYLGAKGCYMWINSLTKEVTALRPPEYVDEQALEEGGEEEDVAGGYPSCPLSGLPDMIKAIIDGENKTPLLIDNSEDEKVTAFLSYKALLVDVSVLAVGYQKSGTKVSDLMETVRKKAICAMKSGSMLALRLGHLTSDHANFKRKLCVRNVFPVEIFQEGGKKIFTPTNKPRCNLMFREEDMEQGQCLVKSEGFRFCALTSLEPREVADKLGDTIPLGYMQPVYVFT